SRLTARLAHAGVGGAGRGDAEGVRLLALVARAARLIGAATGRAATLPADICLPTAGLSGTEALAALAAAVPVAAISGAAGPARLALEGGATLGVGGGVGPEDGGAVADRGIDRRAVGPTRRGAVEWRGPGRVPTDGERVRRAAAGVGRFDAGRRLRLLAGGRE